MTIELDPATGATILRTSFVTCDDCEEIDGDIMPCATHRPRTGITNFERRLRQEHAHLDAETVDDIVAMNLDAWDAIERGDA